MTVLDLDAIASEFLQQCGLHDAGLSATCACAESDYRPTMLDLIREVERLRATAELLEHHASLCDQTIANLSLQNNDLRAQMALPAALAPNRVPSVTYPSDGAA